MGSESWDHEDKLTKKSVKKHGVSLERFQLACDMFLVEREDKREALEWVSVFVQAADEAQNLMVVEARKKRGWA